MAAHAVGASGRANRGALVRIPWLRHFLLPQNHSTTPPITIPATMVKGTIVSHHSCGTTFRAPMNARHTSKALHFAALASRGIRGRHRAPNIRRGFGSSSETGLMERLGTPHRKEEPMTSMLARPKVVVLTDRHARSMFARPGDRIAGLVRQ
jgi:hypothetical protein